MEVLVANQGQDGLCGGNSYRTSEEDNHTPTTSSCVTTDETTAENIHYQSKKSEPAVVAGKSESLGFFRRTLRSVLKIEKTSSNNSYDVECASMQSSVKEGYLSENEDRSDGIDSGIASESGDGPASSRLSSCTNYTNSSFGDRIPGLSGIHNLGNTCYMNAVLQCLAHIDTVVEYFALGKYRDDLKHRRTIFRGRKLEKYCKGKLTEHFATLLKSLWTFGYSKELCQDFKDAVSKYGDQYSGTSQQDAQEFLLKLLEYLHEDLCKGRGSIQFTKASLIKKKKQYCEEEHAARTLATYSNPNITFIKSVFQAQYKSSIICPSCGTYSSTFDPFLCISLPIPQKDTKPMYLIVLCSSYNESPVKIGISVPYSGTVRDLRSIVSKRINVPVDRLILLLVYSDGDHCSLHDESMIESIPEIDDCLFALEVPSDDDVKVLSGTAPATKPVESAENEGNQVADGLTANFRQRIKTCGVKDERNTIALVVTNCEVKERSSQRIGFPIIFCVSKDITFKDLQLLIRREMPQEVRNAINKEARNWKLVLGIRVVNGLMSNDFLKETEMGPLRSQTVERGLLTNLTAGPPHLSLVAEWEPASPEWCLAKFGLGYAKEDSTVKDLEEEFSKSQKVHLNDCLELHTKEEKLHYDEAWKCPNCKKDVNETTKKLALWSLPDVLVFHLKRFQQANHWKGKISVDVEFPLSGLDMQPHLAERTKIPQDISKKYLNSKRHFYTPPPEKDDCVYDLFAVCNHIGPYITSGHYTANCKNSANGAWYCFDDANVSELPEEQVCTRSAYLVFYKRRNTVLKSESLWSMSSINSHWSELISEGAFDER